VTTKTHGNREFFTNEENAQILLNCIGNFRKEGRYRLLAFVIMPDHLHIILRPDREEHISKIMHSIKRGIIRDEKEFWEKVNYIYNNPLRAGLAEAPEDYPYSSANPKI